MLSIQLLTDRAGNFTASENHKLMAGWDKPEPVIDFDDMSLAEDMYQLMKDSDTKPLIGDFTAFGVKITGVMINTVWKFIQWERPSQGLITYAQEKAMEELFEPDPSLIFQTVHTKNGEERELECMKKLAEKTELDFTCIGDDQTHIHANGIGCTPDGIVLDELDLVLTGAEVKCKSPLVHARNLLIENGEELKEQEFEHFVQIQTQMLVTGADHWYFANYNPFAKNENMEFKYIIVGRDDDFIKILQKRIDLAKQIKAEFLKEFEPMYKVARLGQAA